MEKILPLTKLVDLKLFFFIVRPIQMEIDKEGIVSVLAFDLESAIPHAKEKKPLGYQLKFVGNQPVKGLIDAVEKKSIVGQPQQEITKAPQEVAKINLTQFKNNLLLVADDFVKNKEDKIILKRIIKGL